MLAAALLAFSISGFPNPPPSFVSARSQISLTRFRWAVLLSRAFLRLYLRKVPSTTRRMPMTVRPAREIPGRGKEEESRMHVISHSDKRIMSVSLSSSFPGKGRIDVPTG